MDSGTGQGDPSDLRTTGVLRNAVRGSSADGGGKDLAGAGAYSALAATKTSLHLACVRGPDTGAVVAVLEGGILGRGQHLTDTFTDVRHLVFRDTTGGFIAHDVSSANPVSALRRTVKLRPGRRLRVGSNTWIVRSRTGAGWEFPGDRALGAQILGLSRFVLPLMLLSGAARMLDLPVWALGTMVGVALAAASVWLVASGRKKRQQRDPAALLMALAQRVEADREKWDGVGVTAADRTPSRQARPGDGRQRDRPGAMGSATYRVAPRRARCAPLPLPGLHAVVGHDARGYALWMGAQIVASGEPCRVVAGTRVKDHRTAADTVVLAWATRVEDLRAPVCSAIASSATGGQSWRQAVHHLLSATNPSEPPPSVDLASLLQLEAIGTTAGTPALRDRWASDIGWAVPVAVGSKPLCIDLPRHGPHALVVGGTGSGKSELLTTLVLALASSISPDRLRMIFIDYKGGAGLDHLAGLPHVEQSISDLDGSQTPWLLRALTAEVGKRKRALLRQGFRAMDDWAKTSRCDEGTASPPPALLVVVDEIRALADRDPALLKELAAIGAQGRSLGLHLVVASQRPGGVITADMRAVLDLRVALRCSEPSDSQDTIGSAAAAGLPRVPGRAIVRIQAGMTEVQCAMASDPAQWVRAISTAWEPGVAPSFPVPLPDTAGAVRAALDQVELGGPEPVIGLYEEAETCRLRPLRWRGDPLLLVGPPSAPRELQEMALGLATAATGRGGLGRAKRPAPSAGKAAAAGWAGRIVWVGDPPTASRSPGSANPPLKIGEIAFHLRRTLDRALSADEEPPVVVVPALSQLLTDLAASAGPELSQQTARELIDAGHRGLIRLICTDTNPGGSAALFPMRLVHITSAHQSASPALAGVTQRATTGSLVGRVPGRVMCWTQDLGLVHCQLAQWTADAGTSLLSPSRFDSAEHCIPTTSPPGHSHSTTPALGGSAVKLAVIAPSRDEGGAVAAAMGGEGTFVQVDHLDASAWTRLAADPGLVAPSARLCVAALEPTREVARALVSCRRSDAAWALASIPFPPGTGLVCQGRRARPFSLLRGAS